MGGVGAFEGMSAFRRFMERIVWGALVGLCVVGAGLAVLAFLI